MTDPHLCHCGAWGAFGYTRTTVDQAKWFCGAHRPKWTPNAPTIPGDRPIPGRRRALCAFCNGELDSMGVGVYRWTAGWVQQRAGGGGNAVSLPRREPHWAHRICVERASAPGHHERTLFEPPLTGPKQNG